MTTAPPNATFDAPSAWIARFLPAVPPGAPVLDIAAGGGRHTGLARAAGHAVTAVDRDIGGLARFGGDAGVTILAADLEAGPWPLAGQRFGAVIVTNYLHRPLFPHLLAAIAPGGLLLYETFAVGNERFGKPSNPAFLLREGELLEAVRGVLAVLAYEHGEVSLPRPAVIQRIAARRAA